MKSTSVDFCMQVELDRGRPVSIRHRVEVLLPPSIRSEPADGQVHRVYIFTRDETGLVCLPHRVHIFLGMKQG